MYSNSCTRRLCIVCQHPNHFLSVVLITDALHFLPERTCSCARVSTRRPLNSRSHAAWYGARDPPLTSFKATLVKNKNNVTLTCGCCTKYSHYRHFLHVALPELRVADVQGFYGTCKIVVCGDDADGKHDCCVVRDRLKSQGTTARSP